MNPAVFLSFALLAQSAASHASTLALAPNIRQDATHWGKNFSFHFENDSFPGAGGDDAYTQGLELRVQRGTNWRLLEPILRRLWSSDPDDDYVKAATGVIGQTMFTPVNVITYRPSALDRPFAGFLYAGIEASRVRDTVLVARRGTPKQKTLGRERLSVSAVVGVIGPAALARETQSGTHILRENRMAKGWLTSQIGSQPQLNLRLTREIMPIKWGHHFDATILKEVVVGTAQTYGGVGLTVRGGRGLSSFPSWYTPYNATASGRTRVEVGLIGSARWRFMARNAFVSGVIGDPTGLAPERRLRDLAAGLELRLKGWRASYMVVWRTREVQTVPPGVPEQHRFVALNLAREDWSEDSTTSIGWLKNGARFNFRFGQGGSRTTPDSYRASHRPSLAASMGLEHSLFGGGFSVAYETTATTREGGAPAAGQSTHSDLFLFAKAITFGWEPTRVSSRHKFQVRAGGGLGVAKYQVTEDLGTIKEPTPFNMAEKGGSVLVGARYAFRLGKPLSLTADIAAAKLFVNRTLVRRADFLTVTVGIQLHPWNRDAQ